MTNRIPRRLKTAMLAFLCLLMSLAGVALASGQAAVVTTEGTSMNPVYHEGDLVVIARAPSYDVGQIAAFRFAEGREVALHRIIDGDADGFVFKGDNNESIDPARPTAENIMGRAVLHVPQGGYWLARLTSPPMLALVAFGLVTSGGVAATRRNRRRKRAAMSPQTSNRILPQVAGLTPATTGAAAAAGLAGIVGVLLAGLAWTAPLTTEAAPAENTRMVFSYSADVGQSPAYDGTTAESPDPVFRKLADTVDVHLAYRGEPGTIRVAAELSTPEGWHSTMPLAEPTTFTGDRYEADIKLDLKALEAKAHAAAEATGHPAGAVSVSVVPHVTNPAGLDFEPALSLVLSPLQLAMTGEPTDLTVTDAGTPGQTDRTIGPQAWNFTAETARAVSAVLLAAALLAGAALLLRARRETPGDEAEAIRRRYAQLLIRVRPVSAPEGRPVIDVATFPTLAKLAERYGLLVLHWSRSEVETFIVQDENITYRYRTGDGPKHADYPRAQTAPIQS
ncbi:signal peptidase I [Arthrobacter sp. KK5.5]|uniref:signal peptidase I n=1 Tax=Arthrobacter sp. KK5.5 TaxID=3373084 RepID=UPI003EE4A3E3